MANLDQALQLIAAERSRDPLAPVTVVVPSHVAAIQARRRLAELGPFAGVRFETLPRIAELLGAGDLAAAGRSPLARPIGDYATTLVARDAGAPLREVRDLPGFARVLRQTFRRLRRGGFAGAPDVPLQLGTGLLAEVVRLYGAFRTLTERFYDDEDLLDIAAAAVSRQRELVRELGAVYVVPPGALSAGAERLLTALRRANPRRFEALDEASTAPAMRFVLAPDPSSEAREAVRGVIEALGEGVGLHEIAVFHGADAGYRSLLAQAFEAAGVPASALPGTPLSETPAGRGVLLLAELPLSDYARTATLDFLGLAPLRGQLPVQGRGVTVAASAWRRLAREAGVTHGAERWRSGLDALIGEREETLQDEGLSDGRRALYEGDLGQAADLRAFVGTLIERLEGLRQEQAAAGFIEAFRRIVRDYLRPDAEAFTEVLAEVEQLGTIDAIGGRFSLASFAAALRANLEAASVRERGVGEGVLVADYRVAAGLSFRRVVLCGAYEGVFPAAAPSEPLMMDATWSELRRGGHSFVEDAALRLERARAAAQRAVATAGELLTWTAPLQAANAGREYYPSQAMLAAARTIDPSLSSATDLRRAASSGWLRRQASPLAARLVGPPLDAPELRLRQTLRLRRDGLQLGPAHPLRPAVELLRARRGRRFSVYDGNVAALAGELLVPRSTVYPTSLEHYGTCGFRYLMGSLLRLRPPEEPEDRDTIDPAERGTIVHEVLDAFFKRQRVAGRPAVGEAWTEADRLVLLAMLDERLEAARIRGRTGLDVYAEHDRRGLHADLGAFLEKDSEFRAETGAVPVDFERRIPETAVAGLRLAGIVDRVDRTPDGTQAWVIDYKTGSWRYYDGVGEAADPLLGGTKLQLPVYLAATADVEKAHALYWFISSAGEFKQIGFDSSEANRRRFEETLVAILDGVRGGVFPAIPGEVDEFRGGFENCRYCDFDRICSRRRDDEAAEKSADDAVSPWRRVGETARGGAP